MNFFTTTSSTTFTQRAMEATEFSEITQNKGHYAVQGHSRSAMLVPIESACTMGALWNRAGHYIFVLWFLLLSAMVTNYGTKIAVGLTGFVRTIETRQLVIDGGLSGRPTECRYCRYIALKRRCHTIRYDTIRLTILTCTQKLQVASLICRTEPNKKRIMKKLKPKKRRCSEETVRS